MDTYIHEVRVTISAAKVAVGTPLVCGMFEFGLFDGENNLLEITTNG